VSTKDVKIQDHLYTLATSERARKRDADNGHPLKHYLDLHGTQFDHLKGKIDKLPTLADIDSCPPEFLPYLGQLVGYEYNFLLPSEPQRAVIKGVISTYQKKGTPDSILDAISPYDPYAKIIEPYTKIARHNVSKFSGTDAYQDGIYWRTGIFEVRTTAENLDEIRRIVRKYRPAGKRVWYSQMSLGDFTNAPEGFGKFIYEVEDYENIIHIEPIVISKLDGAVFSARTMTRNRSGRKVVWGSYLAFGIETGHTSFLRAIDLPINESHEAPPLIIYTPVPLGDPQQFSSIRGKLSGGKFGEYSEEEIPLTLWDRQNYQPSPQVYQIHVRPATRSGLGRRSGRFTMSGAFNGGWQDKPLLLGIDDYYQISDMSIRDEHNMLCSEISAQFDTPYTTERIILSHDVPESTFIRKAIGSPVYSVEDLQAMYGEDISIDDTIDYQAPAEIIATIG
jgi:hypothetical protein